MKFDVVFWLRLFGYTSMVVLFVTGLLGSVRYRELPAGLRYLIWLVWFGLVVELVGRAAYVRYHSNLWLTPIDAAGELWLLSLVYGWALKSATFTRWRPWVAAGFVLYAGLSLALDFESTRFKPAVQVLESLLVLGMAGLYFRKLLNELQVPNLARDPLFWVSAGLVLYSISKLLIALFSNYLLEHYSRQLSLTVWTVNGLLTIVLYLCYLRALWLRPQR